MSKILITGATGFVGKKLVPALIQLGHEVRCALSKKVDWLEAEQVIMQRLEFETDWSEALAGIDVVIHLAARVHIMKEKTKSALDEYYKINTIATKTLAEQAAKHRVKRFIFLSSIKVNGELTVDGESFSEETKAAPEDPYGQSKLYAEQYLNEISQNTPMQVVIVRPPLIYGPGVKANFLKMLQLVKKRIPLPFASIQNKRHFIYIENLVSALCVVVTHPAAVNQTYLVADEDSFSVPNLMRLIAKEMNTRVWLIPFPVSLMRYIFQFLGMGNLNTRLFSSLEINSNKIKSQLGWTPPVNSVEGLKKTVAWYQSEFNS
ncbi:NAD-dependent epimerase/dehydratase family protein [Legionella longbeachae]|uniref:UDP-glucose 4-epimerase (Galactowaldenase) (UDP-galactose 4-epimerase) n=1 Tax=Legionella longbeachae serogroup 1 (strain NSW150) TaxID=661367 RepID=D3HJ79_LEGLN|nr:NAD-dependent epimerase/dehydratase family protein [Legionella longbeachae]VEE02968.1 UDP-glucose 4-epimerase (Galactowaldenase) (UDP-galactose 4-epimerase) [Legionella oakridgensis]HBD7398647.1 NAD-dependent epimerase/dehydratase family protein [Legionella pneumophila]ARB90800.1 NAD-dependent dehydratase [Legionella longbeachae]ARM32775.1 NAD-dependent epimerase/dehydratase family protein [Legionella longbeachae]EEZ94430.1 UDP-glucose 4-epimerase [Legionella longbeachae D-4968]